jgi:hypothetical protein
LFFSCLLFVVLSFGREKSTTLVGKEFVLFQHRFKRKSWNTATVRTAHQVVVTTQPLTVQWRSRQPWW